MRRFNRNPGDDAAETLSHLITPKDLNRKCSLALMRLMGIFVVSLIVFSVLFTVSMVLRDPPSDRVAEESATNFFEVNDRIGICRLLFHVILVDDSGSCITN